MLVIKYANLLQLHGIKIRFLQCDHIIIHKAIHACISLKLLLVSVMFINEHNLIINMTSNNNGSSGRGGGGGSGGGGSGE